ncbi:hypothetical protein LTR97_006404 [Elasticomyces elasticus]|uniref:Uncharacterized protein n=1 Tax=Elasticomyces elasticus TaxID=574655 RepID=A0AAN7ZTR5_9PEZI|nr:hypothetical protein LTR97_006404 [Elasticomyces elasticus]
MADQYPIICFPQDMEANDVYLSALADIRRSAHFLRLADCPDMAAPLEAYLTATIARHGLPQSTDLMAWLPRHVACLLQQPRGMDELTWLRFKLAERELMCARLSLQMASQYTGREEQEVISADTRRLSDVIRPFRPEMPYERERDPHTLHPLWHEVHKTEAHSMRDNVTVDFFEPAIRAIATDQGLSPQQLAELRAQATQWLRPLRIDEVQWLQLQLAERDTDCARLELLVGVLQATKKKERDRLKGYLEMFGERVEVVDALKLEVEEEIVSRRNTVVAETWGV